MGTFGLDLSSAPPPVTPLFPTFLPARLTLPQKPPEQSLLMYVPPLPAKQMSTLVNPPACPQLATEPDWTAARHLVWPPPCLLGSLQPQERLHPQRFIHVPCYVLCWSPWQQACPPFSILLPSAVNATPTLRPTQESPNIRNNSIFFDMFQTSQNTESTRVPATQLDQMTF